MLIIKKNKFKDLLIVQGLSHKDSRGYLRELLLEKSIKKKFKFHIISRSKGNVLRGLHFQYKKPQGKFVSVLKGKILDVAVDLRKNSKTYGKHYKIILSEQNCKSIYIPVGFAHGFASLDPINTVLYSCTQYRNKNSEHGILWNDKTLKINWKVKKPIISKKDRKNPKFKDRI